MSAKDFIAPSSTLIFEPLGMLMSSEFFIVGYGKKNETKY